MIPYGRQEIDDDDIAAVTAALRAPMLTQGPAVEEFEDRLAKAVGAKYAVAVNSGTAALHAAYFAAGMGPGRSVLIPPITFVATGNASLYLGGGVEFVDVDDRMPIMTPDAIGKSGSEAVRAVVPVHMCGHVCDMEGLSTVARKRGWMVIEDAAHALGAGYGHKDSSSWRVGACQHSDLCCLSFHPVKHITTGEGGAVTTNDADLYEKLRLFRSHGITRSSDRLQRNDGPWYYEQQALGFNYRLTDIQSVLGSSQLKKLPDFLARRRRIAQRYDSAFSFDEEVKPVLAPAWSASAYHLYVIRVPADKRLQIFNGLKSAGIGVNLHYIPVYQQPYYREHGFAGYQLANAERYYSEAITIPMYPGLTDEEVDFVVAEVFRNLGRQRTIA